MNKRILLGVDSTISPATEQAFHTVSDLMQQTTLLHLVLLNVIPLPAMSTPSLGVYVGHFQPLAITSEQRTLAEDTLWKARKTLQELGVSPERIEVVIRVGTPADEIVKTAKELQVDFIVIGSRGHSLRQRIRRFFAGSTSRSVLHSALCPVMIVVHPSSKVAHRGDLVKWYEQSITNYLQEHPTALSIFTPLEVVQKFSPTHKKTPRRKEVAAATLALEQLSHTGILCRHEVKGELRYIND